MVPTMRNHPIVNGKATTFPKLAKKLGISEYAARQRYNRAAADPAEETVTMRALRAIDRARSRRAKRDAKIIHERQTRRRELWSVQARVATNVSIQRIQQIAGALK